jgi:hypothetical protein
MSQNRTTELIELAHDPESGALATEDITHKKGHEGKRFYVMYSVADLGAATTPTDSMTLDFTTPKAEDGEIHFTFSAKGTAGWLIKLVEAPTGGAASPTGQLEILNHNRISEKRSKVTDGTNENQVNYDSSLATGGTTLWSEYIAGSAGPMAGGAETGVRNELKLKPETKHQVSLTGTDNTPGTLIIDWYIGN